MLTSATFLAAALQKYKDASFAVNLAYVRYDDGEPYFYFISNAFTSSKF